jgi:hypothetical protein
VQKSRHDNFAQITRIEVEGKEERELRAEGCVPGTRRAQPFLFKLEIQSAANHSFQRFTQQNLSNQYFAATPAAKPQILKIHTKTKGRGYPLPYTETSRVD